MMADLMPAGSWWKAGLLALSLTAALACSRARQYSSFGVGPGSSDPVGGVISAATASAVSRASGGCYASCPPGTRCIEKTGYCERLPCGGACKESERCVDGRCVALELVRPTP